MWSESRSLVPCGNEACLRRADEQAERDAKIAASQAKLQRRSDELGKKLQTAGVE